MHSWFLRFFHFVYKTREDRVYPASITLDSVLFDRFHDRLRFGNQQRSRLIRFVDGNHLMADEGRVERQQVAASNRYLRAVRGREPGVGESEAMTGPQPEFDHREIVAEDRGDREGSITHNTRLAAWLELLKADSKDLHCLRSRRTSCRILGPVAGSESRRLNDTLIREEPKLRLLCVSVSFCIVRDVVAACGPK